MAWYDPTSWQLVDFGATPHLEDLGAAHAEWLDRIDRFSVSPAYYPWAPEAVTFAVQGAEQARAESETAGEYWDAVGADWTSNTGLLAQWMDPDQLNKLLSLLGQSSYSAEGLAEARQLGQVGTIAAGTVKATVEDVGLARLPWWAYVGGIIAAAIVLKK